MAEELKVIGRPENHDKQAQLIVTGRLDYAADNLPGKKLFARILGSKYAHARIKAINTAKAEALKGVEAIITHEDVPFMTGAGMVMLGDVEKMYWGQEVAVVAATDPDIAEEACGLIEVEYEVLPFVLDADEAMKPGAPIAGIWTDRNVQTSELLRGDIEAGFAASEVTYEHSVGWTNHFQHNLSEPRSTTSWWIDGHMYVRCSSQDPFTHRAALANFFGLPLNKVHLISHGTGCGFGDKIFYGAVYVVQDSVYAAALSKKANGKPVQMHFSAKEYLVNATHQTSGRLDIKFGVKKDGTLTAIDAAFYSNSTANGQLAAGGLHWPIRSTYKCPNGRFKAIDVATNRSRRGAWRCVGDPPGNYLMQMAMDGLADELGMNPLALRLKNIVPPEMKHQDTDLPYASNGARQCLETVADIIDFNTKWHTPGTKTLQDGRLHGIGISAHVDSHGQMSTPVGAIINLTRDGKALINVGITRVGAGTNSAMCHIVAEVLGMKYEDVMTGDWGNTDVCAEGGMQGGSTRVITLGSAFQRAAEDVRNQLFERAAPKLSVTVDQLSTGDGKVFVTADPAKSVTIVDLVRSGADHPIVGRGYSWGKVLQKSVHGYDVGAPCETRATAGASAEVAIDPETGEVEILNIVNAVDMGRAIFYKGAENHLQGGIDIMIGQCLFFEQIFDSDTGAILNASRLEQKWPTTLDMPQNTYHVKAVETIDACGPFGAKGLGEPAICSFSAIASAIHNATGKWINDLPITAQKILASLGKA